MRFAIPEEWRGIDGHQGYTISNRGRVKRGRKLVEIQRIKGRNWVRLGSKLVPVDRIVAHRFKRALRPHDRVLHAAGLHNDHASTLVIAPSARNPQVAINEAIRMKKAGRPHSEIQKRTGVGRQTLHRAMKHEKGTHNGSPSQP